MPLRGDRWTAGLLDVHGRSAMSALRQLRPFDASGPDFTRQPLTASRQKSGLNPREAHRTVVSALEDCARIAEALAEDPLALVSLLEFAPFDPVADAIC